jgi:hypothetical protein
MICAVIPASTKSSPQPKLPANRDTNFHEFAPIAAGVTETAAEISGELLRQQLAQDERQNPAVPVSVISSEVEKSLALFA